MPVNQHDLAITLALFGYVALRSLHRLGAHLSQGDVESFILLWRYVGFVIGIDEELLPESLAVQQEFFSASTLMMGDCCKLLVTSSGLLFLVLQNESPAYLGVSFQ